MDSILDQLMNCFFLITENKDETVLVVTNKWIKQKGKGCLKEVLKILQVIISSLSLCQ